MKDKEIMGQEDSDKIQREKVHRAIMQTLIRVAALERVILKKCLVSDTELAEELASVVADIAETAKKEFGVEINIEE